MESLSEGGHIIAIMLILMIIIGSVSGEMPSGGYVTNIVIDSKVRYG